MLKLWKGLFYALWMCDRPLPQQALCADLADLVHLLGDDATATTTVWLRGFWATMAREWTGIDVLRMDKFLLLVRRVVGASFAWMRRKDGGGVGEGKDKGSRWDGERVDVVLALLAEWPFALDDEARVELHQAQQEGDMEEKGAQERERDALIPLTIPVGLRLHVLDVWVDEAEKVGLLDEEDEEAAGILRRIVDQVDALERATTRPNVRVRSKESLSDGRLPGNKKKPAGQAREGDRDNMDDDGPGDGGSWDGFDD